MAYRSKPNLGLGINWAHPLANGLIGAFLFNERGGPVARESVSQKSIGILSGTVLPAWTPNGLHFVGGADQNCYIGAGEPPKLVNFWKSTPGTIIVRGSGGAGSGTIVRKDDGNGNHGWKLGITTSGAFELLLIPTVSDMQVDGGAANGDFHLAVTHDGSLTASHVTFYQNGVFAPQSLTGDGAGTINGDAGYNLIIGSSSAARSIPAASYTGELYEISFWNRILSAAEVVQHYSDPYAMLARKPLLYKSAGTTNGATLTGVANLAAAAVVYASVAFSGAAALGSVAQVQPAAGITGVAALGATAQVQPASALVGLGNLGSAAQVQPAASLAGVGALGASGTVQPAATLAGVGVLGASPTLQPSAALAGVGVLGGTVGGASLSASLTGVGTLGPTASVEASVSLVGVGSLGGAPQVSASTAIAGAGVLGASGTVQAGTAIAGIASLSGTATNVNPSAPVPLKASRFYAGPLIRSTRLYAGPLIRVTRVETFPN